jgi:hypothetical protein
VLDMVTCSILLFLHCHTFATHLPLISAVQAVTAMHGISAIQGFSAGQGSYYAGHRHLRDLYSYPQIIHRTTINSQ